jgi:hypothetical protein
VERARHRPGDGEALEVGEQPFQTVAITGQGRYCGRVRPAPTPVPVSSAKGFYESAGSEDGSKSDGFSQRPFEPLGVLGPTQV